MIVYTRFARGRSAGNGGIALWPFAFIVPELKNDKEIYNHEQIHLAQQRELWVIPFYILYVLFWFQGLIQRKPNAYFAIPFEREAFTNQDDPYYLSNRNRFAWVKYR